MYEISSRSHKFTDCKILCSKHFDGMFALYQWLYGIHTRSTAERIRAENIIVIFEFDLYQCEVWATEWSELKWITFGARNFRNIYVHVLKSTGKKKEFDEECFYVFAQSNRSGHNIIQKSLPKNKCFADFPKFEHMGSHFCIWTYYRVRIYLDIRRNKNDFFYA